MALIFQSLDSPIGLLTLVESSAGLIRIAFESELSLLPSEALPGQASNAPHIENYFNGTGDLDAVRIDPSYLSTTPFRAAVYRALRDVGYGRTVSYAELAAASGHPRAVRAVGSACGANPLPLVIPCHRVVRSDGAIGAYRGGTALKKWLLEHESVEP